ncbi:MAG: type II 3-dehydroquinate dehydratase [Bacteroidales bacterium]
MKIAVINGPNLNLLGKRETGIYGNQTMKDYFRELEEVFTEDSLCYHQSNDEAELITTIHRLAESVDGIVLNPGGLTHTSVVLADAIRGINIPVVEVHVSHVMSRESYRKRSLISAACLGSISGFGMKSYELGICALTGMLKL